MAKGSKKPSRDVAVGAMFALALIVLALVVMALGDGSNLFRSQVHYVVVFPSVEDRPRDRARAAGDQQQQEQQRCLVQISSHTRCHS